MRAASALDLRLRDAQLVLLEVEIGLRRDVARVQLARTRVSSLRRSSRFARATVQARARLAASAAA